ncbi:DNA primase [Nitrincola iocasae]|uniref:DNA primase n=1 Tax=Nitrincola iocasae TaxID=2614693 RepID=A0A5J6LBX7_9GAMM|nr:DNA primase [Nitrincola iocasae]QEW05788.1 DNA primase [Nitrincola iocasae]
MAGRIPQYFIDDLLARINITDIVESRVKLRRSGKNYSGLCPFHKENSPSFTVSPDKQFYYCFGCGAGGNALGFLMEYERLSFPEAVEELARLAGVDIPREEQNPQQIERDHQVKQQISLLDQASQFYREQLRSANTRDKAIQYLQQRGLSGQIASQFQIGYAPAGWDNLIQHFSDQKDATSLLEKAGMVIHNEEKNRHYDRFRDRIMFPIRDMRGRVIAFGGRVLGDDKPKYLNSPETDTFHKSRELYGLYEARQSNRQLNRLLIVEGYMDVVGLAQNGITWAVATLGTATTEQHLIRLFKLVPELIFCFDGDQAGRKAALRALDIALPALQDGKSVRFLFLPEGEDPDSLIRQEGQSAFEQRILNATPLSTFFFNNLSEGFNLDSMDDRARLASTALPPIRSMQPGLLQQMMLDRVSEITGLSAEQLASLINLHKISQPAAPDTQENSYHPDQEYGDYPELSLPDGETPPAPVQRQAARSRTVSLVNRIISIILHRPALARELQDPEALGNLQESNIDLLIELITYLRQHPDNSLGTLLVDWQHDTQRSAYLMILNEISHLEPVPETADPLAELNGALTRLLSRHTEIQLDRLLKKKQQSPLTQEEKNLLQQLLLSGR